MVKTMRKQFSLSLSALRSTTSTVSVILEVKFKLGLMGDWFCFNLVLNNVFSGINWN